MLPAPSMDEQHPLQPPPGTGLLPLAGGAGFPATNLGKRGPVACKRCRRAKTKCLHAGAPPCRSCAESGLAAECIFPPKGTSFVDRTPVKRAKRNESDILPPSGHPHPAAQQDPRGAEHDSSTTQPDVKVPLLTPRLGGPAQSASTSVSPTEWDRPNGPYQLPPTRLLEEAAEFYFARVNQCAFLHKQTFMERIRGERGRVSPVLLLAICALTARFSPGLSQFRESTDRSTAYFSDAARRLLYDALDEPTVEACQAGYLLGLVDLGACKGRRAWIVQGIAIRMAFLLGLHREEAHQLPPNASAEDVIAAEEARRTFWTLYINDCCFSNGVSRPPSILPSEITTALPCEEDSFTYATQSPALYLEHLRHPGYAFGDGNRSMFAHMVQVAELWGNAARWACDVRRRGSNPTDPASEYSILNNALIIWTTHLPSQLKFTRENLLHYYERDLETAFVYNHVMHHSAQILLRRPYLPYIIRSVAPQSSGLSLNGVPVQWTPPPPQEFWARLGREMFTAAITILEIVQEYAALTHSRYTSLSVHLGFSTFLASATLCYAWRWPWLFPERAYELPDRVTKCTDLLAAMTASWPMAKQWVRVIKRPLTRGIEEHIHEDVAKDQDEGIYRDTMMHSDSASWSGDESGMDHSGQGGQTWSAAPSSLHALAVAATESVAHVPGRTLVPNSGGLMGHHPGSVPHKVPGQNIPNPTLPGQYSDMPFGDPSQPQTFNDVMAFMDGGERWPWPTQVPPA